MSFAESIKTCLSKYVTFSGRAGRPEYWWFLMFIIIASAILGMVDRELFGVDPITQQSNGVFASVFGLATFLPLLAAGWRRMHDTGKPGWYLLLPMLIPFAFMAFMMMGVIGFAGMENAGVNQDALRGSAMLFGMTGMIIGGVVQLVPAILLLWWLTRPSDTAENEYGPVPAP